LAIDVNAPPLHILELVECAVLARVDFRHPNAPLPVIDPAAALSWLTQE
jgi:hypothetical protein